MCEMYIDQRLKRYANWLDMFSINVFAYQGKQFVTSYLWRHQPCLALTDNVSFRELTKSLI